MPQEPAKSRPWTGPRADDWEVPNGARLKPGIPPERWPYGPPSWHHPGCNLFTEGLFCDCEASDSSA